MSPTPTNPTDRLRAAVEEALLTTSAEPAEETHVVTDDSDDPEHADDCPGCEAFSLTGHAAAPPAPVDRATVLTEAADTVQAMNEGCSRPKCVSCATRTDAADALRDSASRLAVEVQQPTATEPARGELWSLLDWTFWGSGMGDVFREPLADTMLAAISPEQLAQAEELMEAWHASGREPLGRRRYEELSAELREARQQAAEAQQPAPAETEEQPDTLAPWLYQRFMVGGAGWDHLDEEDRSYWEHHARAVRRAVVRGGFKAPAVTEEPTPCGNTQGLGTRNPYRPCARPAGHPEAYCKDATGDHLFLPATHATEEPK